MPRLANIFVRRQNDSSSQHSHSHGSPTSSTSNLAHAPSLSTAASSSTTLEGYLSLPAPSQPIPSSPNGKNKNSSSRNGLGGFFGRKKSQTVLSPTNYVQEEPQPASLSRPSTSSALTARSGSYAAPPPPSTLNPPHRMGPALSTRSLPTLQTASSSTLPLHPLSPLSSEMVAGDKSSGNTGKSVGGKSGRRFAFWTRGAEGSLTKDGEPNGGGGRNEDDVGDGDAFNLRAFRHIGPIPSPIPDASPSPTYSQDDVPRRPRPRERGGSDASNASSRISVAAFREAVARRERETGRMSPSLGVVGGAGSTVSNVVSATATPQPSFSSTPARSFSPSPHPPIAAARPRRQLPASATPTDAATSEHESDSDSDNTPLATLLPPRRPGSAMSAGSAISLAPSSRANPKPKPLIDIAALTAAKPGVVSVNKEENGDGFTGGGMLGGGGSRRGEQQTPVLTSRSPPVRSLTADADSPKTGLVHFPSPPSSPVREVPPSSASLSVNSSTEGSGANVKMKTEGVSERLRAVVGAGEEEKGKGGDLGQIVKWAPNLSPRPTDAQKKLTSTTTTIPPSHLNPNPPPPASTASPSSSSTTSARKTFHRRSSSDIISAAPKRTWADEQNDTYRDSVLAHDLAAMLGGGIALVSVGLDDEEGAGGSLLDSPAAGGETKIRVEEQDREERNVLPPIVIHQRSPSPAFSVTSRPVHVQKRSVGAGVELGGSNGRRSDIALQTRERTGSTVIQPSSSSYSTVTGTVGLLERSEASTASSLTSAATLGSRAPASPSSSPPANVHVGVSARKPLAERDSQSRHRSSMMTPLVQQSQLKVMSPTLRSSTLPPSASTPSTSFSQSSSRANLAPPSLRTAASNSSLSSGSSKLPASLTTDPPPRRPFVPSGRLSPTSSTGESSSDPALLTPWDWSDTGTSSGEERGRWRGGVRELVARRGGVRRRSVSVSSSDGFGSDGRYGGVGRGKGRMVQKDDRASRAIEFVSDDTDEGGFDTDDLPLNQARMMDAMGMGMGANTPMNMPMTPAMGMNMPTSFAFPSHSGPSAAGWGLSPLNPQQFMIPAPPDPSFYAAHQQAMMIAKQAYLTAVGQQAMAAAGEEWERGSSVGGSVYGGGGGGSVYGGSGGSVYGGGGGMGGWGPSLFPPGPQSMYGGGGGGARSEYGGGGGARSDYGGGGGGNWNSSRSVYGESFRPSTDRYARTSSNTNLSVMAGRGAMESTGYLSPGAPSSRGRGGMQMQMQTRQRTASQPADPSQNMGAGASRRPPPPPSSWRKPTS
ncbi:hypothetical protein R3P38DRAFT_3230952 [Favolaschia claudopus]|uniref:Uncharacterized protein n=1 Tax=Favolaschia claudopus TaxID=2862362 RepID=A0AAV9ZL41_9AGAR